MSSDLVGFAVGVLDRDRLITGEHLGVGDVLIGLLSPGLRLERVLAGPAHPARPGPVWRSTIPSYPGAHRTVADELLEPSVIYAPAIAALLRAVDVRAIAHITGGGITGNLARVLPSKLDAVVLRSSWEPPRIFDELQRHGEVTDEEMARVFNLGIGMARWRPRRRRFYKALDVLRAAGQRYAVIGISPGRRRRSSTWSDPLGFRRWISPLAGRRSSPEPQGAPGRLGVASPT